MTRKKIVFILPNLRQGGAERIVTNIINSLDSTQYDPILLLLEKDGYYLELLNSEVKVIDLKTTRIRNSIFKILKSLRRIQPDIVFSGYGEINALLSAFIPFFPKIKFVARETNVVSQHVTRPAIKFWYRFYSNYHKIVAQSQDMQEDLIENWGISPDKITRIANPVNIDFITQNKEAFYPKEYEEFPDYKKVVAIGNISYRKGFDNLLKVFAHLKNEPIALFILGEGPQMEEFQNYKKNENLDKVHFFGKVDNPYPYLKNADLFVLSSRYEGFPNVLLEAGACGTYSLANNCPGGIDEIIIPHVNGEILDIENHKEFAQGIKNILPKNIDTNAIIESIQSRYDQPKIMEEYAKLLSELN